MATSKSLWDSFRISSDDWIKYLKNNLNGDYNNSLTSQGLRFGGFPGTEKYSLE